MSETLDRLLKEWRDPLGANTFSDAEDLIHMLMVELAGKEGVINVLQDDIKFYREGKEILGSESLKYAGKIKSLERRIKFIEPVYYLAHEVASWDWVSIRKMTETDQGFDDLLALCKELEGH